MGTLDALNYALAGFLDRRCAAVKEPQDSDPYHGQCELKRGHEGRHALERGAELSFWSTREYIQDPLIDTTMRDSLTRIVGRVTDYEPFLPIVVEDLMRYFDIQYRAQRDLERKRN